MGVRNGNGKAVIKSLRHSTSVASLGMSLYVDVSLLGFPNGLVHVNPPC